MQRTPRDVTLMPSIREQAPADAASSERRSLPHATLLSLLAALFLAAGALRALSPSGPSVETAPTHGETARPVSVAPRRPALPARPPIVRAATQPGAATGAYTLVLTADSEAAPLTPDDGRRVVFVVDSTEREAQALAVLAHLNAFAALGASVVDER